MRPRSQLKTRHRYSVFLALAILACFAFGQVSGFDDGTGDADDTCVGCHSDGGNAIISMSMDSDTYEAGESGIEVTVTVNMDIGDSDAMLPGIMLLSGSEENIKDAGWEIFRDPNENPKPVNYNEKTGIFLLRSRNTDGSPDIRFAFGPPGMAPLMGGDWNRLR